MTERLFFKIGTLIEGGAEGRFAIVALVVMTLVALAISFLQGMTRRARQRRTLAKRRLIVDPGALSLRWIPDQAFGLSGMTSSERTDQPESV